MSVERAIETIENFQGHSLTGRLSVLEDEIKGANTQLVDASRKVLNINADFMREAFLIKRIAGQINVVIHAAGILQSLPHLLEAEEVVESVSLGAGNTGKKFDLETNLRVAEYKFIDWKGGPESIRQNQLFKDFYALAEYDTPKKKYLYVLGTQHPLKFFEGKRALTSVLSRVPRMLKEINENYGNDVCVVRDYFELMRDKVSIRDIRRYIETDL